MVMQALDVKRIPLRGITWTFVASAGFALSATIGAMTARNVPAVSPTRAVAADTVPASPSQARLVIAAHHLNTAWYKALTPGALLVDETNGDGIYSVHKVELVTLDMQIATDRKTGAVTGVTYRIDALSSGNACSRHADAKPRYNLGPSMPAHACGFQTPDDALRATKSEDFVGGPIPVSFDVTYVPEGNTLRLARSNSIFGEIMAPHLHSGFAPTRALMQRLYAFPAG